jgi:hypothetical protein
MEAELERIVAADEEARVRVDGARAEVGARVTAARLLREHAEKEKADEAARAVEQEARRILAEADAAAAERARRREAWLAQREAAAAPLLSAAADAYARIVRGEEVP